MTCLRSSREVNGLSIMPAKAGIQKYLELPGFRLALAIRQLGRNDVGIACEFARHPISKT